MLEHCFVFINRNFIWLIYLVKTWTVFSKLPFKESLYYDFKFINDNYVWQLIFYSFDLMPDYHVAGYPIPPSFWMNKLTNKWHIKGNCAIYIQNVLLRLYWIKIESYFYLMWMSAILLLLLRYLGAKLSLFKTTKSTSFHFLKKIIFSNLDYLLLLIVWPILFLYFCW